MLMLFSEPSGVTVGGVATWARNVDGSLNAARQAIPANMVDQIIARALLFLLILRIDGITSPPETRLGRRWVEITSREPHREGSARSVSQNGVPWIVGVAGRVLVSVLESCRKGAPSPSHSLELVQEAKYKNGIASFNTSASMAFHA